MNIGDTELDLGRSFDSISLKPGRTVISIVDWNCMVFGTIRPNEGGAGSCARGELGIAQIREFVELTTDFSEIQ